MKFVFLAFFLSILITNQSRANDAPLVAAASSLRQVWPLLMQAYAADEQPRVTFGSSGNLARQIMQRAPFELFLSADKIYPEELYKKGISTDEPVAYTTGALAWVALPDSPVARWIQNTHKQLNTNKHPNTQPPFPISKISRLAIANPAFAPYGRTAKQVLEANDIDTNGPIKLTLGENAAQALQFALSGATGGGIVPLSLVSGAAKAQLPVIVVSEIVTSLHQPLVHSMALIGDTDSEAQSLFTFLLSEPAQRIFESNGFRPIN